MELTEFDEGAPPVDWAGKLERRGIAVRQGILREAAREVLRVHSLGGGKHY